MLLFSDEIIEFVPGGKKKNGTIKSRTLKTYFTLRNVLSAWLYAGIFTGLLLYRLGWGVLFYTMRRCSSLRQWKANILFNFLCLVDEFSSWWPDRRILRRSEICKYFNARKYLRRIIEASDCRPIARTLDFWIMPQIHFWFLHYSLLNI
jgi:hypothetical protein